MSLSPHAAARLEPSGFAAEAEALVAQMTREEQAGLLSGSAFWLTKDVPRLGLEKCMLCDGPHGLRKQENDGDHMGTGGSRPSSCFPAGGTLAAAWDATLANAMGGALGRECAAEGVSVVLGPAINMKRHPLCGRNFEYYSEDPHLAGELAAAFIDGVQACGIGTSVKHYAANNQEFRRMRVDTCVDERTLREIYLPAFEAAVTRAQPWTVMAAYNRLNGHYATESSWLLQRVLRDEWRFRGLVVSDWMAVNDRVAGLRAGMDLEMPSSGGFNDQKVIGAVANGTLDAAALEVSAVRVAALLLAARRSKQQQQEEEHAAILAANHAFARRAALESAVLLKNDDATLPLPLPSASAASAAGGASAAGASDGGGGRTVAVIGSFATHPRYQGAGSSRINPHRLDIPLDAIRHRAAAAAAPIEVSYAAAYDHARCLDDPRAIEAAVAVARRAASVVCLVGLPSAYETEACDRDHMRLPRQMNELVAALARAVVAPARLVVVLHGGAPVELPWADSVPCILHMGLGGQAMGSALASLLFGDQSPSGKLPETWPLHVDDCASHANFATHPRQVVYREALNVGYRQFSTHRQPVRFAFGHGLTYSSFRYANLRLSATTIDAKASVEVAVDVTNTGATSAREIVQLYVRDVACSVHRPDRELRAFAKTSPLPPGRLETLRFTLPPRAFAYYDVERAEWYVEPGAFEILLGASVDDIRLVETLTVRGEVDPSRSRPDARLHYLTLDDAGLATLGLRVPPADARVPYSANSTIAEIMEMNCLVHGLYQNVLRLVGQIARHTNLAEAAAGGMGDVETLVRMIEVGTGMMNLRGFHLMSGGAFSPRLLETIVHVLNGKLCSAIGRLCCGEAGHTAEGSEAALRRDEPSPSMQQELKSPTRTYTPTDTATAPLL